MLGGFGWGFKYMDSFRKDWATGTGLKWDLICPTKPGPSVDGYLYLTATNRAARGVEAHVLYHGQNDAIFTVFDWSREHHEPRQITVPFVMMREYLQTKEFDGATYQTLSLINYTYSNASEHEWINEVWLFNHVRNDWDKVYDSTYQSTSAEQHDEDGSLDLAWWGPMIETHKGVYRDTSLLGSLSTQLRGRDAQGVWGEWMDLGPSDSFLISDGRWSEEFLYPNHAWGART